MIVSVTVDRKKGGIANSLISYSKALNLINEKHLIVLPKNAAAIEVLQDHSNVEILELNKKSLYFHIYTKFILRPDIAKHLKKSKWIFIHNSKLLKHFSNFFDKTGLINHSGKLRNTNHKAYNIFITQSGLSRFLKKYPDNVSKNIVICHGFDLLKPKIQNYRANSKRLEIIAAGRFIQKKGFEDLIDTAVMLKQEKISAQISLYGEGPLQSKLANKINELELANISLMGWCPNLRDEFTKYDIFCIPSLIEPFGLIIGEAMMNGLPIISTKTDGALEIFGGLPEDRGGILVDFSSPNQIVEAISRLQDEDYRDLLSCNAKANIENNFSLKRLSTDLKQLIDDEN